MTVLGLNDTINIGKNKKVQVSELVAKKGEIFNYIKKGVCFDNEVLEMANIRKKVSDEKIICTCVSEPKAITEALPKETESLRSILKSLHTLDNTSIGEYNEEKPEGEKDNDTIMFDEEEYEDD